MYLKELSITGFKSFAKKSELKFSDQITAIVGPNGSGKSNIAESFRFVLGEQSVKSMRGKRGEDLIWGGSEQVSRGNRASVEILFDNQSRTFGIDFDEIKLERIVHRDGQNEYKLNDSVVRLKDVHELLANANIGSTGHHIISQGEADRILTANPKERREMIEDALGLKIFQIKKLDSEKKLAKTRENIAQVESLRREAAPHLKYLKKQVEKAERAIQVKQELTTAYAEYLRREDTYVAHHHDRVSEAIEKTTAELEDLKKQISDLKAEVSAIDESQDQQDKLKEAKEVLEGKTQARQQLENQKSKLEGQISLLTDRLNRPKAKDPETKLISYTELKEIVEDIREQFKKVVDKEDLVEITKVFDKAVETLEDFIKTEPKEVVDDSQADQEELDKLSELVESLEKDLAKAVETEQEANEKLAEVQAEISQENQTGRQAEKEMFTLMNSEREVQAGLNQLKSEINILDRDRDDFKRELQEAVTLVGRQATDYFSVELSTEAGEKITDEDIVNEDRSEQTKRRHELEKLKIRLEELGIGATDDLLKEYKSAQERDEFLANELSDLESSVENLKELIADMQAKLQEQFTSGLSKITKEFNAFFTLMFGGGSASVEPVTIKQSDEDDDTEKPETGVDLKVNLPNKRVKGLDMLSGGERALTSIALIFAMSQVNPPPFIILDETDAALDEANSRRYGDMIEALAKRSQLVLITHNRETMSRAGVLYGITMGQDGVSKTLSVKFAEAEAVAK